MRQSRLLIAGLLAFLIVGPGAALAFDVQTLGNGNADGSVNYSDPDDQIKNNAINGITVTPGANFSKGAGTPVPSYDVPAGMGWQQLQPIGRLTR